ncbi:MAG: L,D-transpeptidase family protein [Lysobacter sp.]|nr:L,D-transpeptidase family protein [Lysobacter sp.]
MNMHTVNKNILGKWISVALLSITTAAACAQSDPSARAEDAVPSAQQSQTAQTPPSATSAAPMSATLMETTPTSSTLPDTGMPASTEGMAAPQADAATPPPQLAMPIAVDVSDKAGIAKDSLLRAQILLDRAHFSPGEIDGAGGSNTRKAIAGFQRSKNLPDNGELDAATWAALDAGGAALVSYTLTVEDVAGPFNAIPADMMAKSKLAALGYTSVEEALGEKFHSSPALLQTLNAGKDMSQAGTELVVPNVTDIAAPAKAAKVIVDKSDLTVALADAGGTVFAQFPASTGSKNDPLPIGDWKVTGVARNPDFHYNPKLFWDANPKHSKAKIPAGPNNPVGTVWVDLSKEHYGIHGTPEPSRISKSESHGCIRLTNWTANMLAASVSPGTPALLQE